VRNRCGNLSLSIDVATESKVAATIGSTATTLYKVHKPPMMEAVCKALADVKRLLKPPHLRGHGYKECRLPLALRTRME